MNKIGKYIYVLGLSLMSLTTACEDQSTEITSINYERLFSPLNLEARVTNRTNIRLTWTAINGATGYNIELYANDNLTFTGTPIQTIENVTISMLPYTVQGLEGETQYSIRVQATGENISPSKWATASVTTDAEQIFESVTEADLTATSATLRWTAGETATEIVLTPGDITHAVTAEEIAAGAATISGLTSEMEYTAKLMNGTKTRGTATFTTLIDLAGATAIEETDNIVAILTNANDGDAFALYPGTYDIGMLSISKNIEIKAVRSNDRPLVKGAISLSTGASLTMKQIILDGGETTDNYAFGYEAGTFGNLTVDDCEVRNYVKGLFSVSRASDIQDITFKNCLIHDIACSGADFMDCRAGVYKTLTLSNSTVYNSATGRDFIRFDYTNKTEGADQTFPGRTVSIKVSNCTLDGVSNADKRLFYIRFGTPTDCSITFENNLVTNMPNCKRGFTDSSSTPVATFNNNCYYNTINLTSAAAEGKGKYYDTTGKTLDPGYKDAANGDFTVSNEDVIYYQIGDPRWY